MAHRECSVYRTDTGAFTGVVIIEHETRLAQNTPEGCALIEGRFDHLAQRVDVLRVATDRQAKDPQPSPNDDDEMPFDFHAKAHHVIDWQPPQPSPGHEWNATTRRWRLTAEAQAAIDDDIAARAELEDITASSIDRMREMLADSDPQLRALDNQAKAAKRRLIGS